MKKAITPKAAAAKSNSRKTKASPTPKLPKEPAIKIKYADKSAGQPDLLDLFETIKKMMEPYSGKRKLVLHADTGGQANLVSHQPVEIKGKKRNELWVVSALVQKGYVGFYYSPVALHGNLSQYFSEEFIKCLKGKSCFHIRKKDPKIMQDIKKAIQLGYEGYLAMGWI
ncbi:MAG: DUF1801 domain-containing protein [Bacteroidota bacterium]|nr:DUF1801 domain-containing protein [Bacteroidota bacterium]